MINLYQINNKIGYENIETLTIQSIAKYGWLLVKKFSSKHNIIL